MKSNVEKVSNLVRKLNVEIPAETVSSAYQKILKLFQKQANIKGFRPGKAPLATIKSVYGDKVKQDLAQELIQSHYFSALKEHKIEPINYPEFEFDAPNESQGFSFSAHFEVKPNIDLKKYEGLEVEKERFEFDEQKIEQVLNNIRSSRAQLVDVLEDRAAINGDTAVIDFEGMVDGKPLENGSAQGHQLELGAKQFIDGFEEGVVGMRIGSEKTLNLKFPEEYQAKDIAGKEVQFKVTLKGLKKKDLPELTDDFLKSIGSEDTVENLKTKIREDLEQSQKKQIESDFKNQLLKVLVSQNPVEVPPSMLKEQKQILVNDMKKRMMEQGMPESDFAEYETKWQNEFESSASEMIQSGFLIDAIANKHNLRWTDTELEQKLVEYSKQTGIEIQKIREFYARPEQTQRLTYMITEEKVIEFLTKSSKIKEITKKSKK